MKKLILTVAVTILTSSVSISAFANNNTNNNPKEVIVVVMNEEFKEIAVKELPEAVAKAFLEEYETAAITKAYVNGSEQYKIEFTVNDTESVVYADKEGKWLKEEDVNAEKVE
jgi:hypothetical protein